jgi:hypothetical protein
MGPIADNRPKTRKSIPDIILLKNPITPMRVKKPNKNSNIEKLIEIARINRMVLSFS